MASGFPQSSTLSTTKKDPGGKPATQDSRATPLAGSVAFRDWVVADREYKESIIRVKYT